MEIRSTIKNSRGQSLDVVYYDMQSERDLGDRKVKTVHAYCFHNDKLVVVYSEEKDMWTPPGGSVEEGEDLQAAVCREVVEEANMKVLHQRFIGFQDVTRPDRVVTQVRSVCLVEPYGPFISDPDGDITKIELIDPKDYKNYLDWGVIGDRIMERALDLKLQMGFEVDN